jgi:predicted transcriptional regulator
LELVHRTNVYLTDEEQAALDARAEVEGSSRSVVLRSIVDEALNLTEGTDAIDAALAEAAGEIAETARHLSADDPELRAD